MLLQIEILTFFASFGYIVYYFGDILLARYKVKIEKKEERMERQKLRIKKSKTLKNEIEKKEEPELEPQKKNYISPEQGEQIREISKRAQINISRGYLESARSLIVEGLALKKEDKDLNLLLADVYEREKKYQNAEYIYRDLLDEHIEDEYILQRLGNIYSLRGKNDKATECYTKALKSDKGNTEILDILTHLYLELKDYKNTLKYSAAYLKEKPRNAEKLSIKGYALEMLGKNDEAIKTYKEVLQLQPYNSEIQDRVSELEK